MRPSLGWQVRFLKGFLAGDRAAAPPFALLLDVTRRCNLTCLHCRRHSPLSPSGRDGDGRDFPFGRFLDLCREARAWGVRKMVLIGEGEPLLHPHLTEMIAAARGAGCRVVLLTNGTLIDPARAAALAAAGLDELRVTLWAAGVAEYRAQYPGTNPENFHRTLAGIRAVAAAKRPRGAGLPRLVLHRPIEPRHYRSLPATVDLAAETGCDAVSFSPLKPLLPADEERLFTPGEEAKAAALLREAGARAAARGLAHNTAEVRRRFAIGRDVRRSLPCYIGWTDMRVRVDGDVVPCDTCDRVMGNVMAAGLREVWNAPEYRAFRRRGRRLGRLPGCTCDFCCHALTNERLHRRLRWLPRSRPAGDERAHDEAP